MHHVMSELQPFWKDQTFILINEIIPKHILALTTVWSGILSLRSNYEAKQLEHFLRSALCCSLLL